MYDFTEHLPDVRQFAHICDCSTMTSGNSSVGISPNPCSFGHRIVTRPRHDCQAGMASRSTSVQRTVGVGTGAMDIAIIAPGPSIRLVAESQHFGGSGPCRRWHRQHVNQTDVPARKSNRRASTSAKAARAVVFERHATDGVRGEFVCHGPDHGLLNQCGAAL